MILLSNYFSGIGAKRLSSVEINPGASNQHEFNGINEFRAIFGSDRIIFKGKFMYLDDNPNQIITEDGALTWYDARANHPTRTEYRLYYSTNSIIANSSIGDLIVIGRTGENELAIIVASEGSTAEQQIKWLFGLEEIANRFVLRDFASDDQVLNFAGKHIISTLGFEIEETVPDYLEQLLVKFGSAFPTTAIFSEFARSTVEDVSAIEEPDTTLITWLEREELLFRTLEKYIVEQRLYEGFAGEVDNFISYSLSVHNRRKSRAGHSFEHHLASIFEINEILFSKGRKTERNNKPDFLFPTIENYHNEEFSTELLTMLGVKTSAKDRWRQVLSEADKIENKHLITLEPAISNNQTEEMREQNLQLVIPSSIQETYTENQQSHIIDLNEFISLVKDRQQRN
ncbi:type II restriction endonuclease [Zobellia nedashkovskayae]|uniref:type II restriction endonuclease n=1 Tax=Zobellia nedashkovskayae TaxID=2779510 RepID=UPI00188AD769|nr:type II restriction endonuclease [Zobellia nedashkovskayae]